MPQTLYSVEQTVRNPLNLQHSRRQIPKASVAGYQGEHVAEGLSPATSRLDERSNLQFREIPAACRGGRIANLLLMELRAN